MSAQILRETMQLHTFPVNLH